MWKRHNQAFSTWTCARVSTDGTGKILVSLWPEISHGRNGMGPPGRTGKAGARARHRHARNFVLPLVRDTRSGGLSGFSPFRRSAHRCLGHCGVPIHADAGTFLAFSRSVHVANQSRRRSYLRTDLNRGIAVTDDCCNIAIALMIRSSIRHDGKARTLTMRMTGLTSGAATTPWEDGGTCELY